VSSADKIRAQNSAQAVSDKLTCNVSAQEFDFLQRQRPWERATVIVNGTPTQPYDQRTEIMLAPALY